MNDSLQSISYGTPSQGPGSQNVSFSRLPFEATLICLRDAIQAEGLWLIQELDPQALLKRGGYAILPTRQLLFFHPRYMVRILENDPSALLEVPLKLVIQEMPDGKVSVRRQATVRSFQPYSNLHGLSVELDEVAQRLVATVSL